MYPLQNEHKESRRRLLAVPIATVIFGATVKSWISALPFIIGIGNILGIQTQTIRMNKQLSNIVYVFSGRISPLLSIPFIFQFGAEDAGIGVVAIQALSLFKWGELSTGRRYSSLPKLLCLGR
jgi:hypothetical protein